MRIELKNNDVNDNPLPDKDSNGRVNVNADGTKKYWGIIGSMRSKKMNSFVTFLFDLLGFR
jgi:hypothetical protein